jgi:hypothetical protein
VSAIVVASYSLHGKTMRFNLGFLALKAVDSSSFSSKKLLASL